MIEEQEGKLLSSLDPTRAARTATATATVKTATPTATATTTTTTSTTATATPATATPAATVPSGANTATTTSTSDAAAAVLAASTDTTTTTATAAAVPCSAAEGSMDIVPTDTVAAAEGAAVSTDDKECAAPSADSSAMEVEAVVEGEKEVEVVEVKPEAVPSTEADANIDYEVDAKEEKEVETKPVVDGSVVVEGDMQVIIETAAAAAAAAATEVAVEVKNEVKEEVDVKVEGDNEEVAVGAQDSAFVSTAEEGGKEQKVVEEEVKMEESEAREWRRLFVSACRWFDLDQV